MRIFLTVAFALAFICFFVEHGYCKIEDTDFVGMWLFDDEDGTDSSINGNHGQFNGDPDWGDGKFGSALLLNGSNYLQIPNTDSTEITEGPLSVVCWFNGNTLEKSMVTRGRPLQTGGKLRPAVLRIWSKLSRPDEIV